MDSCYTDQPGIIRSALRKWRIPLVGALIAATAVVLAGCSREGGGVAGKDPVPNVFKVESDKGILRAWILNKADADALVHIDIDAGITVFPPEQTENIRNATARFKRGDAAIVDQIAPLLVRGGAVNLGYEAGFFQRVIWVMTSDRPVGREPVAKLKEYLMKSRGYPESAVRDLESDGRRIKGTLAGVPIEITSLSDLAVRAEKVLIDIDLAYFMGLQAGDPSYKQGTRSLLSFMDALAGKNLKTDLVTINLSTINRVCPMDIRFFGDVIRELLVRPARAGESRASKWMKMIAAEDSVVAGRFGAADGIYADLIEDYPEEAGLHFSQAIARGFLEDGQGSREALLRAYGLDSGYLRGFFQLANVLAATGKISTGAVILETPYLSKIVPQVEMNNRLGLFFLVGKRYDEAAAHLRRVESSRPRSFALQMALYEAYRGSGREDRVVSTLEKLLSIDSRRVDRSMPWIYMELGKLYERIGIADSAVSKYERFLELAPGDSSAAEARKSLAGLRASGG